MNQSHRLDQGMNHTSRYKPSKELLMLTKRKMDEAQNIISRLEKRLKSTNSCTERKQIMIRLDELKQRYDGYIQEFETQQEVLQAPQEKQNTQQQSTLTEMSKTSQPTQQRQQLADTTESIRSNEATVPTTASQQNNVYVPLKVRQGMDILSRRLGNQKVDVQDFLFAKKDKKITWADVQRNEKLKLDKTENERLQTQLQKDLTYRSQLREQTLDKDWQRTHRTEIRQSRPRSPKIYDSTFQTVGMRDMYLKYNKEQLKQSCNEEQLLFQKLESERKQQEKQFAKNQIDIDMSNGVYPTDRYDENGRLVKSAIPPKYLKGRTFDNQSLIAPERKKILEAHDKKSQREAVELSDLIKVQSIKENRDIALEQKRKQRIDNFNTNTNTAMARSLNRKDVVRQQRFGSVRYDTDNQITYGPHYDSRNRILRPDDRQQVVNDVIYDKSCFVNTISAADYKRSLNKVDTLPLTQEEIEKKAFDKFYKKFPQKRQLDGSDMRIIQNYIKEGQTEYDRYVQKLNDQQQYNQELAEFAQHRKNIDHDEVDQRSGLVNFVPQMINRVF